MNKKLTYTDVKNTFSKVADYELLSTEYINNHSKLLVKHSICGKEYTTSYDNFIRKGQRCRCLRNKDKSINTEIYKERLYTKHNTKYELVGDYINSNTKVNIKCNSCTNIFKVIPSKILEVNKYCPYCSNKGQGGWNTEKLQIFLNKKYFNNILLLNEYKKDLPNAYNQEISCKFINCNHIDNYKVSYLINSNVQCKICHPYKLNTEYVKNEIENLTNNEYLVKSEYVDTHTPLKLYHIICKKAFSATRNNFVISNTRCPYCNKNKKDSKSENEIYEFIQELLPNELILKNDRKIIKPKELDIYLPNKKIAIEFNGLYWHSETQGFSKFKHYDKLDLCTDKDIRLITIFEDEWLNKKKIVKEKLKSILGINSLSKPKIYARNCYIKEINAGLKDNFLELNHIQGKDKANIKLGLFTKSDNKLISVMTFCKLRLSLGNKIKYENHYELSRFASDIDFHIVGAFSKIFKYFCLNFSFDEITTYADLRWSIGNIYDKNNFEFSHISDPSYFYINKNTSIRYHRFNFRKAVLKDKLEIFDSTLSEYKNMLNNGYHRIWDCGNMVFKYKKKMIKV